MNRVRVARGETVARGGHRREVDLRCDLTNADGYGYSYSDGDFNSDINAYGYCDGYGYTNGNSHSYSDRDSYGHSYAKT